MNSSHLHIKNMVCPRCIKVVRDELESLGVEVLDVELGYAKIKYPNKIPYETISDSLNNQGFELIEEEGKMLVEEIKVYLLKYLEHIENNKKHELLSSFLSKRLGKNYSLLSSIFSEKEGITLEKRFILLKIERVKELLDYNELNLSQISYLLGYSSVNYLSSQFRKITGTSVTDYKKSLKNRKFLNEL